MRLPHFEKAIIDTGKLAGYVLNAGHPEGRHKARVFLAALGLAAGDAAWLTEAIRAGLRQAQATLQRHSGWGEIYRADMEIARGQRCARIRTVWLCTEERARLVTCFVIGDCNETA